MEPLTAAAAGRSAAPGAGAAPPVPPGAPLEMPVRGLRDVPRDRDRRPAGIAVHTARVVSFAGTAALTVWAAREMWLAISVGRADWLQIALMVFFVATFAWIGFAAMSSLAGLLIEPWTRRRSDRSPDGALPDRTVLVMPLYNEQVAPSCAALLAMAERLIEAGHGDRFELFILSDSNRPESFVRETAAFATLRERLAGRMAVWYRRRSRNVGRKAGNVKDFVSRWGARYEAMVTLDADSVMSAETLVRLARAMHADPDLGILQTVPRLVGGSGAFARMQQFASGVYGPVVGKGIAAWQGEDGNYWGHNAIIRVAAFASACGLPELAGREPFGGSILSHDFVEAAWMRRAGWAVRLAPDLTGSWEGSPPTLLDVATRDRRWAQGNLQHSGVLAARGLAWPNRAHFTIGILSYLASPLWLALISVGLVLSVVVARTQHVYFGSARQLFPDWPRFDAERMVWLFALSLTILVLPKLIGLGLALADRERREASGGGMSLLFSGLAELLVSACYAPIVMLMQTRQIAEILLGRDSGWSTQHRDGGANPWRELFARHAVHTGIGLAVAAITWWTVPTLAAWMAPTIVGLAFAIPLSRASGDPALGRLTRRIGLFRIPEERDVPIEMVRQQESIAAFLPAQSTSVASVLAGGAASATHFRGVEPAPPAPRGAPDPAPLVAREKLAQARTRAEALGWLDDREVLAVLSDPALHAVFVALPGASSA